MYLILTTPNPILTKVAKPVIHFDKKLQNVISEMSKTLLATTDPKGVGLAAPQVGLSIRLFLTKPTDKSSIEAFINPKIQSTPLLNPLPKGEGVGEGNPGESASQSAKIKPTKKRLLEGCLSLPNIWGHVSRPKIVELEYQDALGKKHSKTFKGFMATIIQHEIDHLNGTLFTKHVMAQKEQLYRSYKNEKGEDEFDEIRI